MSNAQKLQRITALSKIIADISRSQTVRNEAISERFQLRKSLSIAA